MSYPPQGYPPPGWSGYGPPPGQFGAPPPKRNGGWVWVLLASAVVLTVVGVVAAALLSGSGDATSSTAQTSASVSAPDSSTATTTPTTSVTTSSSAPRTTQTVTPAGSCQGFAAGPGPQTPAGWQPVVGPRGLAYDVPADWSVEKCGVLVGWEKACPDGPFGFCPIRSMSGAASLEDPKCPRTSRAVSGLPGAKNTGDINAALQSETALVKDIYTAEDGKHAPTVALGPTRNLTVGGASAVQVIATVTDIQADDCTAPSALHSMIATTVPGQEGCVLFVISLEQGYPGAPDPSVLDGMVASLRPAIKA